MSSAPLILLADDCVDALDVVEAELRLNADLDDALFTYSSLEARRDIPGISDR